MNHKNDDVKEKKDTVIKRSVRQKEIEVGMRARARNHDLAVEEGKYSIRFNEIS